MGIWTIIAGIGVVVGIAAGVVQVLDYLQKRRRRKEQPRQEPRPLPPPPAPTIPHNLPSRTDFIGRAAEKARVYEALRSRPYLVSIDGIGGIGKTVLALEVAHECLRASKEEGPTDGIPTFSGFIWTTAKDRELTSNALLDAVARTLEYPGIAQQPIEDKRVAVRKLLQEKPYLLIVDNFETITDEGVRDFLHDLPEPSKALITTREQKLRHVWAISLKGLTEPEALAVIRNEGRRLGLASLERAEDPLLSHLYQATGGAPLAIRWAVGQIKQKGQSLDTVLVALHEARGSIFDAIFARSWGLLSASARQVLMVMPIFATSASRAGIEAASDVHHYALDEALGQLVEMSLVDATDELDLDRRRYSIHPLTRAFAEAKLKGEPEALRAAHQRLAEYFQSFAQKHGGFWSQGGFDHLEPELPNILATIRWCWRQQATGQSIHMGVDIFLGISDFMIIRGYWNDVMALGQQAADLASEMRDEWNAARLRVWPVAWICRHRGDLASAEKYVLLALPVFERLNELHGIAFAKRHLGRIASERGDLERAEELLKAALAFYQSAGDEREIYNATANLAEVALRRGDLDAAWALSSGAVAAARQFDDPERIAALLGIMGGVARRRGDLQQAHVFAEEALAFVKRVDRRDALADALFALAQIEMDMGQKQAARQLLSDALETYERLDIQSKVQEVKALLSSIST